MADTSNLTTFLGDVADAIREKRGTELPIPAADFDTEIRSITTGSDTSDATATADDILYPKTAYVDGERITGSIVTERLPSSLTVVDEEKDIIAENNDILDYFVLNDKEFVISSSNKENMASVVIQNSNIQNTININDIKSGCVLLCARLFDFNVSGEIGMLVVIQDSSTQHVYFGVVALNINTLQISNIYVNETIETIEKGTYCNIVYNNIKDSFAILLRYHGGQGVYTSIIKCTKNSIQELSAHDYVLKDYNSPRTFIDGYWSYDGTELIVRTISHRLTGDRFVCFMIKYNDNLMSYTSITIHGESNTGYAYQFLNNEYLINGNNQIYKINDNNVSLYKTINNININNKHSYDKIIVLDNTFYLYFSINNEKIYVYKYDAGFNFTFEKEISWVINPTNAAYSYLMYCPIVVNNVIKYNELDKIKEIYTTTDSPDFASLERNGIKYFNTSDSNISAGDVLENKIAYGKTIKIMGTMPNNGELNYDVSTSKQTIPAGYTSGGTIAASPLTQDDYNSCLDLSYNILGVIYRELELLHIGPDKTIDFGITVDLTNTYKLKFRDNTVDPYEAYIGVSVDKNTFLCRDGSSNGLVGNGMTKNLNTIPSTTPEEVIFNFSRAAGNTIWSGTTSGSSAINAEYDFYYLQVYSGDELINNFVPVREMTTNKTGLLDKVTNTFIEY